MPSIFTEEHAVMDILHIFIFREYIILIIYQVSVNKKSLNTSRFVINRAETTEIAGLGDVGIFLAKVFFGSQHIITA